MDNYFYPTLWIFCCLSIKVGVTVVAECLHFAAMFMILVYDVVNADETDRIELVPYFTARNRGWCSIETKDTKMVDFDGEIPRQNKHELWGLLCF